MIQTYNRTDWDRITEKVLHKGIYKGANAISVLDFAVKNRTEATIAAVQKRIPDLRSST
jgi:hypothetical protein